MKSVLPILLSLLLPIVAYADSSSGTPIQHVTTPFSATAATGTATSTADTIGPQSSVSLSISYSGITGSPSACTIQPKNSIDGTNFSTLGNAISISPGASAQRLTFFPGSPLGKQVEYTYACSVYPGAGTITLTAYYSPNIIMLSSEGVDSTAPPIASVQIAGSDATNLQTLFTDTSGRLHVADINSALPAGANTIGAVTQASGPWTDNLTQVGSTNVVTGGVAGTLGVGGTQANNASITANPVLTGAKASTFGSAPTAATAANIVQTLADIDGSIYVRDGNPNAFGSITAALSTTLTQIVAAPAASHSVYVTDILVQSTTTTASTLTLKWGTGTNCATGTVTGPIFVSPATTVAPTVLTSVHWLIRVPAATALCVVCGSATNTCQTIVNGYVAP